MHGFLLGVWKQGGLAGATPDEAFGARIGLGATMTPQDVLDGLLRLTVLLAVTDPGHFIELTFSQQMRSG